MNYWVHRFSHSRLFIIEETTRNQQHFYFIYYSSVIQSSKRQQQQQKCQLYSPTDRQDGSCKQFGFECSRLSKEDVPIRSDFEGTKQVVELYILLTTECVKQMLSCCHSVRPNTWMQIEPNSVWNVIHLSYTITTTSMPDYYYLYHKISRTQKLTSVTTEIPELSKFFFFFQS